MEQYYFKTRGDEIDVDCIEPCMVRSGVMIGSVVCQECKHCTHSNATDIFGCSWIACERINEATALPNSDKGVQKCDATKAK
jgi:hypothetical protein